MFQQQSKDNCPPNCPLCLEEELVDLDPNDEYIHLGEEEEKDEE